MQENLGGRPGASLLTGEEGYVTYRFAVASAGLYNIGLHYYPLEGKGSSMIRTFEVDGSVPFAELREIDFPRIWRDKEPIGQDSNGNDTRPAQEEPPRWLYTDLHDSTGYYNEPLQVYLSAGEHTLTIFGKRAHGCRRRADIQRSAAGAVCRGPRELPAAGFGRRAGILPGLPRGAGRL